MSSISSNKCNNNNSININSLLSGGPMKYAGDNLKNNKELMMKAIQNNTFAIQHASN